MRVVRTTTPDVQAAGVLAPAKRHLRIEGDYADVEIVEHVERAIEVIQGRTNRQLLTATFQHKFDAFPIAGCWNVPFAPLASVTSIKYTDEDGTPDAVWADTEYEELTDCEPGVIRLGFEKELPAARDIAVEYTAGYGSEWTDLPPDVQHCALLVTHQLWHHREGLMIEPIENLIIQLTVGDEFIAYA